MPGNDYIFALNLSDLEIGTQRAVNLRGRNVLLCRTEGGVYALADLCPHAQQPLAGSPIEGKAIRCRLHGARFNILTGIPLNSVTRKSVAVFPVRIREGVIEVNVPPVATGYLPQFAIQSGK